jgi:structural maintenance of chromosomes protein 5
MELGTGKSALTHAICLACAGAVKSVGRADDTSHYIKVSHKRSENEDISFCEVDILRAESIVTVRRVLSKESKSSKWFVDGKSVSQTSVKQLMDSLNIDVDNLCSFMPQDRVGSFTQQSAKGVLERTLECIKTRGDRNLHEEQMLLAEEQKNTRDLGRVKETQEALVANLQLQIDNMKSEVDRIRQRGVVQETLQMYEVKLAVKQYQTIGEEVKILQVRVDEAVRTLSAAQEEIQPLEVSQFTHP